MDSRTSNYRRTSNGDGWGTWLSHKVASAESVLTTVLINESSSDQSGSRLRKDLRTDHNNEPGDENKKPNNPPEERKMTPIKETNDNQHYACIDEETPQPFRRRNSTIDIALADAWGAVRRVAVAAMGLDDVNETKKEEENLSKAQSASNDKSFLTNGTEATPFWKDKIKEKPTTLISNDKIVGLQDKRISTDSVPDFDIASLDDPFEGAHDIVFQVVEENHIIMNELSLSDADDKVDIDPLTKKPIVDTDKRTDLTETLGKTKDNTTKISPSAQVDQNDSIEHFGLVSTPNEDDAGKTTEEIQTHTEPHISSVTVVEEGIQKCLTFTDNETFVKVPSEFISEVHLDGLKEKFDIMFEQNGGTECVARVKEIGDIGLASMKDTTDVDVKILAELDDTKLILNNALQRLDAAVRSKVNDQHPEYADAAAAADAVINETKENASCRHSTRQGHFEDLISDGSRLLAVFATKVCDSVLNCLEVDKETATWSERVEHMAEIATFGVSQLRTVSSKFADAITETAISSTDDDSCESEKQLLWPKQITRLNEVAVGYVMQCVALAIAALQVEAAERAYRCSN